MKGRESGMPGAEMWETFFNPTEILIKLGLEKDIKEAVEFGCGYGTFAVSAAKIVKGKVYAIDIVPEMTAFTQKEADERGLTNIATLTRDFMVEGTGLNDSCVDFVMLFNILHIEQPEILLGEACRILRKDGKLGIIHWNYDPSTPRGPSIDIRPRPEDCIRWAEDTGFHSPQRYDFKPYHYGIVLIK